MYYLKKGKMENMSVIIKKNDINNLNSYKEEKNYNNNNMRINDANINNDLFYPFYQKFNQIFEFIKDTKENKNDLEDEIDENLIKTLYNLCHEFINYIKNINNFGNLNLNENDQELIIESYEKFVRQCKEYNDKPKVKQLENEISNLLDLLFNNTSEAVNTLFSADSFFVDHVENLKLRLNERNQKIEFEKERLKKLELEEKVEEFDETFEENKKKNNEMDETISKIKKEINKLNEKIEKYDNYMKKKRKEIDIDFSDALDGKERIKILEESIKTIERNMKTTQLSPLKIIEKTPYYIIFEFTTPRNIMQFRINNYESENVQVEVNPYDQNILSYINENIKKCKDISEVTYLIKEAIYLNFLDI
ncbi:conserved Plasmodium protein, unknown function [Plasmodium gallinaceum]|uniref:Uncharacterized protein n=1 Tax=Plasmodium gallinaceum TaxID=5849 RepID=A0A1J1GTN3_PLAGA|nr:conserved Plasmodium protein, unknown function [Plasmodium gallinaceum]CRG94662.1 conserved Plasmodium protein, unknown function [Plasmodium gallinaceum]